MPYFYLCQPGAAAGFTLGGVGWLANLIVFLIQEFNVKSINAAQIYNIANGSTYLFPIIGAIVADSFLGSIAVVAISASISLLVILLLCCNLLQGAFLLCVCLLLCLLHSLLQLIDLLTLTNSAYYVLYECVCKQMVSLIHEFIIG